MFQILLGNKEGIYDNEKESNKIMSLKQLPQKEILPSTSVKEGAKFRAQEWAMVKPSYTTPWSVGTARVNLQPGHNPLYLSEAPVHLPGKILIERRVSLWW